MIYSADIMLLVVNHIISDNPKLYSCKFEGGVFMQTINITAQYPIVITPKIEECRRFYTENFGFDTIFESDWYIQLKHKAGIELAFMSLNLSNQPEFLHPEFNRKGIIVTFEVINAKEEYEKAEKIEGLQIVFQYKEEEWGQKHFILKDPAGIFLDIVQQLS
jgi:catechol 2,3-dioxygenase-like lactoylglutathione lyase family enzyme